MTGTGDLARAREIYLTAASIVDPNVRHGEFAGTMPEAIDALVAYAADMQAREGDAAGTHIARHLVNAQQDRVAEVFAAALLRLAELQPPEDGYGPVCPRCKHLVDDHGDGECDRCPCCLPRGFARWLARRVAAEKDAITAK